MTPTIRGFSQLRNCYVVEGVLTALAPLHVGSGYGDAERGTDSGFISDAAGPFLPGSSIRGVLRSRVERLLQAIGGTRCCVLFAEGAYTTCPTANAAVRDELDKEFEHTKDERLHLSRLLGKGSGLCDVCRLFGSPLLASKLRIADARPVPAKQPGVTPAQPAKQAAVTPPQPDAGFRLNKRDGVGIDRDTETARDKIKFDYTVMEQHSAEKKAVEFRFRMELENVEETDLALLAIAIGELTGPGMEVGGKKSRGFGRVRLGKDFTVEYFDGPAMLRQFLTKRKLEPMTGQAFTARMDKALETYFNENPETEDRHAETRG